MTPIEIIILMPLVALIALIWVPPQQEVDERKK
jgi:hypothetical protein